MVNPFTFAISGATIRAPMPLATRYGVSASLTCPAVTLSAVPTPGHSDTPR